MRAWAAGLAALCVAGSASAATIYETASLDPATLTYGRVDGAVREISGHVATPQPVVLHPGDDPVIVEAIFTTPVLMPLAFGMTFDDESSIGPVVFHGPFPFQDMIYAASSPIISGPNVIGVREYIEYSGFSCGGDAYTTGSYQFDITSVPEPAAWALMLVGFGLVGAGLRKRGRAVAAAISI